MAQIATPTSWVPVAYITSTATPAGALDAVQAAVASARFCVENAPESLKTTTDEDVLSSLEETVEATASLLWRHSSLICRFIEAELDFTSPHDEGIGRIPRSALSADTHPRLGAVFRKRLAKEETWDPVGQAIEDIIATAFVGSAATNMFYDHSERRRPLDVAWPLWLESIPGSPPDSWPNEVQGLVGICSDAARGRFYELADALKLGKRALRKDQDQVLVYLATLYTQAGAALEAVASSALDVPAEPFTTVR